MMGRRPGVVLVSIVTAIGITAAQQDPPDAPVFRSRTTAVSLDVSVKRGNRPVLGLTAADFEVTDNGVPQTVEQAYMDTVPIDASLLIDAGVGARTVLYRSQNEVRTDVRRGTFENVWRDAQRILGLLRTGDRARVLLVNPAVSELLAVQTVGDALVLPEEPVPSWASSLYDAILAGLVTRPDPERRRLLVVITDGVDSNSITAVRSLEGVARRADAVLHIISVRPRNAPLFSEGGRRLHEPGQRELEMFEGLPALTGGAFHGPLRESRWSGNIDVMPTMRAVIEEFRQSYVIQYTPRNVAPGGWHDVVVRVKGVDQRGVRTRAGYFDVVP